MLRGLKFPSRKLLTSALALTVAAAASTACFKTLDESLLDDTSGGSGGGGSGGAAAGGSAGDAGSAGVGGAAGQAGSGGASDAGMDADAAIPITVEPWSQAAFPSTDILGGKTGALISPGIGGTSSLVYFVPGDVTGAELGWIYLAGGTPSGSFTGETVDRASALLAPPGSAGLFVGVGVGATDEGKLLRFLRDPMGANPSTQVTYTSTIGHITGMTVTGETPTPTRLVLVTKTSTPGQPHVLITDLAFSQTPTMQLVFTDPDGNQTGGPVVADKNCAYWVSNGRVWAVGLGGGTRVAALATQTTDATGVTSDGKKFYVSRANGEIWQRSLFGSACDAAVGDETRLLTGFTDAEQLLSYGDRLAFIAGGSELGEGGVFSYVVGSTSVQQVVPASKDATRLRHFGQSLVIVTSGGVISTLADGT